MKRNASDFSQKQVYTIARAVNFGLLWLFFFFAMHYVLDFWEKNQLFRYSTEYIRFFEHDPLGVLFYLNTFFIQFSYHTWLGAAVYAGLFWLMAYLLNKTLSYAVRKPCFVPGWLMAGLLLPTTATWGLLWVLVILLILLGGWCWLPCRKTIPRYLLQALVVAALVWAIKEYTLLACLFYIGVDVAAGSRQHGKIKHYMFWPCWIGLLLSFGMGWVLWQPYVFVKFNQLFALVYAPGEMMLTPFLFFHSTRPVSVCLCIGLLFFVTYGLGIPFIPKKGRCSRPLLSVGLSGILLLAGGHVGFSQSASMRHFQKVDTLCREYRWEEALRQLNRQWDKKPDMSGFSYEKSLFTAQTKVALLATRKATQSLFTYPQPAFPMLFPLDVGNHAESFVMPPYYLYVGGFGECLHIGYDFITAHNISPNTLRSIIMASLILDDTVPVSKMVHLLENTLFYRREAALYRDVERRGNLPAVVRGKTMLPPKDYEVRAYTPDENAFSEYRSNPDNPFFYEYYLCVLLYRKQHALIPAEMPAIQRFYQRGNQVRIPRHIQEALLANFDYMPMRLAYPEQIEGVSRETWLDYWQFLFDNQSFQTSRINFSVLQKKWGHTYWFHDCYLKGKVFGNNSPMPVN